MRREQEVRVTLNDDELARLDELRPSGMSRPAFFRTLLQRPPDEGDVATRQEALAILTRQARDGGVSAAIALERALRAELGPIDDALDKILGHE